jgi:hypothetical protein
MGRTASSSFFLFLRLLFLAIAISFALSACSDKKSHEDQVRQFVAAAVTASESREALAIHKLISDKYKDESRRDRRRLVGLAVGYFLRHKNINIFTQISEINFPVPGEARVKLYAAMAGSPVRNAQALLDIRADLYQFNLMLTHDSGEWLLQKASWQRASLEDIVGRE